LNSGFREAVVRKHFSYISLCFCDWESAAAIVQDSKNCIACAASVFGNRHKLRALIEAARTIKSESFEAFRLRVEADAVSELEKLPYIGAVTKFHLAKNLGLDVAKPDRHLVRVAKRFGYKTCKKCVETSSSLAVTGLQSPI
jgi:endonuclease III